ncbi:glycosyltransferase [Candidatus Borrarchaeum sp.]|uniref:glycosyltransferase family 4 protein n=1 Tax=Candidatus Borrarchaeum sp. TaxID=2846742 RepID=UPI00257FD877|nr:glycosyltransferase [Candidatus Borrarchaeum sp.]
MYKVFLTGGEPINWATDDDLNLLRKCLSPFCEFTNLQNCDVIHSVNWYWLRDIDPKYLAEKYVIAHIPHDVRHMLMRSEYHRILPFVDKWIVMSKRAKKMLKGIGCEANYVPYTVDLEIFHKINGRDENLDEFRRKYSIPNDKYLIGSFQRDTKAKDLKTPKYMKGPDVFFEIIKKLYQQKTDICVILAGPRRFWLINQFLKYSIPFVYIGERLKELKDDIFINNLPQETINYLYNIIDLYLVTSRIEGGPKALTECAATKCKILSTNVGHAADILETETIYFDPIEGIDLIVNDIENNSLLKFIEPNYRKILEEHTLEKVKGYWERIYRELTSRNVRTKTVGRQKVEETTEIPFFDRLHNKFRKLGFITILHTFHKPPWGGGNQFLIALKKAMQAKGWKISTKLRSNNKICLFNSFLFDMNILKDSGVNYNRICMINRVDGPTFLVRGKDKDIDDAIFKLNEMVADFTVFQSYWSYQKTIEMGYTPKRPIVIPNAVDPTIFHSKGRIPFSSDRKIRLISTSWSRNPRKGFEVYKWIEENLDWSRFEYTFAGNTPFEFENICHIRPQPSKALGSILRNHDIYITASKNDPCSNALIEALACGLPSLYLNEGGHPEIVGYGGLGFNKKEEILPLLNRLVKNYELYQNLISIPTLDEITEKYLSLYKVWKTLKNVN